jgi:16S rRNA (guanine527-N7)-methyltransferase
MERTNKNILIEGAKALGIHLDENTVAALDLYLGELLKWNQKINLTAIRTESGIVQKHFLDSLSVLPFLPEGSSLLDMGAGAGFPGIPLKIVQPSLVITLIDSIRKKVDFQRHIIRLLDLKGIEAIQGRVQDKEVLQRLSERFDVVLSRGFADLRTFLTLGFPFLKKGGILLAMRGKMGNEETRSLSEEDQTAFQLRKKTSFLLPLSSLERTILLFEKQ